MDIADWLRRLDLGQYEAAFRENSVTADVLPSLTPEDLKDLGITAVGHRRRLLDAIAALRTERAARDDSDLLANIPRLRVALAEQQACARWRLNLNPNLDRLALQLAAPLRLLVGERNFPKFIYLRSGID